METSVKKAERIGGFDWLRCVAICAVIVIHTSDIAMKKGGYYPILNFEGAGWYSMNALARFCVPVFLLMTAFLAEKRYLGSSKEPASHWKRYALPLLGANLVYLCVTLVQMRFVHKHVDVGQMSILFLTGQVYYHTWYLSAVLIYVFLHPTLRKILSGKYNMLWLFLTLILYAVPKWHSFVTENSIYLLLFRTIMCLPYYGIGILIARNEIRVVKIETLWLLLLLGIGSILIVCYAISNHDTTFYNLGVLMVSVGLFIMALRDRRVMPERIQQIASLGLGIYLWHPFVLVFLRFVEGKFYREYISGTTTLLVMVVEFFIALILSYFISLLLSRIRHIAFMAN